MRFNGRGAPYLRANRHADLFEENQVGGERYNFLTGCKSATTATIVLRGGSEQFVEEARAVLPSPNTNSNSSRPSFTPLARRAPESQR